MEFSLRSFARLVFGWEPATKLSETDWLNGVRGLAAFLVLMSHYSNFWTTAFAEAPFGATVLKDTSYNDVWIWRKGQRLWGLWRLPILRVLFCDGGGQVAIFFVISGFVLTWSPLKLAQSGDCERLYRSLASSTFRRWSRLYLPCIAVTLLYTLHWQITHWEGVLAFIQELWTYLVDAQAWANPFRTVEEEIFANMQGKNLAVWTIPYEFSGSLYVYFLAFMLGRVRSFPRRITVVVLITFYAFLTSKWALWLFGTGMALADYSRHAGLLARTPVQMSASRTILWSLCLIFGLFLLSYPVWGEGYDRPPYDLGAYFPLMEHWRKRAGEERFWWGCGAILIMTSICHLRLLRRFFETSLMQYLGKISFMLYLIHLLMGGMIGTPIQRMIYKAICIHEEDKDFGTICKIQPVLHLAILVSLWVVTTIPALIAAHLLETFVDRPLTRFGKKVDDLLLNGVSWNQSQSKQAEQEHLLETEEEDEVEMGHVPQRQDHAEA